MAKKRKTPRDKITQIITDGDFEEIKKDSDNTFDVVADAILRTTIMEKKPNSQVQLENELNKEIKKLGVLTPEQQKTLFSKIEKKEMFQYIVENQIKDEDIVQVYQDALKAEKINVVDKEPIYSPDHTTRMAAADKVLKLKGVDLKSDDDNSQSMSFSINLINPNDFSAPDDAIDVEITKDQYEKNTRYN